MNFDSFEMIVNYISKCNAQYSYYEEELKTLDRGLFSPSRNRIKEIKKELKILEKTYVNALNF